MANTATPALRVLSDAGVDHAVHEYEAGSAAARTYGQSVAAALGVSDRRLFKTLVAEVDGAAVMAVVPVSGRLDAKALARAAGGKRAVLVDPATAERLTGYVTGGISPFGQRRVLPAFVDSSIADHPTVFVSGGRRGLQIEVTPADLVAVLGATVAAIGA